MNRPKLLAMFFILILAVSCTKTVTPPDPNTVAGKLFGDGVFIINEGNFMAGNGSLSFYSYNTSQIYNDIFSQANGRPLGDVPNSMVISGTKGFIIVNNSGKIEVVDKNTLISQSTITGLISPRNILIINNEKAYVSSLYSNSLSVINLSTNLVSGSINIGHTSEAMVLSGNKAFISCWASGNKIIVINTSTDKVVDSVIVAQEPESMVLDKNNRLWVLCNGGYTRQNFANLMVINTTTYSIERQYVFPSKLLSPTNLQMNSSKDTVLYVENGIWKMSIQSTALPVNPFRQYQGRQIYKFGIDQRNGRMFYTDALDYQQKGYVLQLSRGGLTVDSCKTDIIPGSLCFK
jgi:YVTN family beta-propeller protein